MKAYGVKRRDRGCCPGHDKYPADSYRNRRSKRARAKSKRLSHKAVRARERRASRCDRMQRATE